MRLVRSIAACCALCAGPALGHSLDQVDAIDVVERPGQPGFDLELSVGVAVLGDGDAAWICHEAITADGAIQAPNYERRADGGWIAALRTPDQGRSDQSVWTSDDGCDWTAASGLSGLGLVDLAVDPTRVDRVLGVALDEAGLTQLVHSDDGGQSWTAEAALAGVAVHGVRIDPSGQAWVGAVGSVWVQPAGQVWSERPVSGAGSGPLRPVVVGLSATWVVEDPPSGPDTVFHTTDGQSWAVVSELQGEVVDATADPAGGAWFVLDGRRAVHTPSAASIDHRGIGLGTATGSVWLTAHPEETGWLVGTLTPSALTPTWVPTDLVAPLDCPVGSDMDLICGPRWASLESRLQRVGQVDEPRDSGAPSDEPLALEPRCGCTTSGGPGWIAVLAPLFLLRRRPTRAA